MDWAASVLPEMATTNRTGSRPSLGRRLYATYRHVGDGLNPPSMIWAEVIPIVLLAVFGVLAILMMRKGRTGD